MSIRMLAQLAVFLAAIAMGARMGGVGLGLWGGVGLAVLVLLFNDVSGSISGEVLLIIVNHSFMIPSLVATITAVCTGLIIAKVFF